MHRQACCTLLPQLLMDAPFWVMRQGAQGLLPC